ncbi:MAG: GntR family transcriptional regulator, partial [Lactobacillus sp.]|nr:GntR family transcriptional regulator [Lactobacillus sp.]
MNLKQELFNLIHEAKYEDIKQFSTSKLADKLGVKRNTVSHYLNLLVSENKIIKIKTRPVMFLDRENLK